MSKKLLKSLIVGGAVALPLSVQAAPTAAAEPALSAPASAFNMTVGGTYEFYGALKTPIRKVEKQRNYGIDFFSDAELAFRFEGENSGWVYGAVVELNALPGEALASDGSNGARALEHKKSLINADEVFAYVDSDKRGRFELGNTNSAPIKMSYWAPNKAGTGLIDGSYEDFLPALPSDFVVAGYLQRETDDSLKATYFTPRWKSLQFGLSYTPNAAREGRRVDFTRILDRKVETVSIGVDKSIRGLSAGAPLSNADYKHAIELGANFVHDFNDVSLAISGGYSRAQPRKRTGLSFEDWQSLSAGFNVGYHGFTLGGSFVWDGKTGLYRRGHKAQISTPGDEGGPVVTTVDVKAASAADAYGYSLGLQYEYKDFIFGLNYYYGQGAGNTFLTGKNEKHVVSFGTTYHLFPGLDVINELTYRHVRVKSALENTAIAVPSSRGLSGFVKKDNHKYGDFVALTGIKITL